MSSHSLYEHRQQFFFPPSATARGGLLFCILAGVVTFIAGLYTGEAARTWGSYVFNLFFFFAIALGGSVFACMQDVISAKWGRPVMRLHESFASFLPVAFLLFAVLFACILGKVGHATDLYTWIKDPSIIEEFPGKRDWLKPAFMVGRDLFALLLIVLVSSWQLRVKLRGDMAMIGGNKAEGEQLGSRAQESLRHWSAPVLVIYALTFSLLAFDVTMSLSPTWYSTLWGGWSFAAMMQSLIASLLLFMYLTKGTAIGQLVKRQQFHDVGKMMHGFTIFFAYLTYAHILTIWYGNMPEETQFFITRMQGPWKPLLIIIFFAVFVLPLFSLLPKFAKWTAGFAIPICSSILLAQWLVSLMIVIPTTIEPSRWTLPWIEVGAFLGFLGLFLTSVFRFGRRYPMVAIADPLLAEALADAHH
ncbi:MAG: hypothetical protein RL011_1680 [Pseudomonadota bacterium]